MDKVWNFLSGFINGLGEVWNWLNETTFDIGDLHITIMQMLTTSLLTVIGIIIVAKLIALIIPG